MPDDLLPKGPGGPVVLDTPVYDALAFRADRGNNLTITGPNVRVIETQTGRTVYIGSDPSSLPLRLKIKTAADANGVAVCNTWDGTTAGTQDINVLVTGHFMVGEVFFAMPVTPTTGVTLASDSTKKVDYLEYSTTYLIPVKLEKDGGDPGNKTNQCSLTYTAKSLSGIILLTAATPIRQRPPLGAMIVATAGECTFVPGTGAGTGLVLWGTDEWQAVGGC